jgi:hypothetical protein
MADTTFQYVTRPTNVAGTITTMPRYRGTKSQPEVYAEIAARLGATPPTVANVIKTLNEVIIDWTIACWKIEALDDGLIGYQCGCGGSAPVGSEPPNDFFAMNVALSGFYGRDGRDRAVATFSAEKVGEQNRVTPVFVDVYESLTRTPNHYVSPGTLTIILGNQKMKFDPGISNHFVRYRKADGTFVSAGTYPYYKGGTIVANMPSGLTGALELRVSCEINGSIREGTYPFPLT